MMPKYIAFFLLLLVVSCDAEEESNLTFQNRNRPVPSFSGDSAYSFVEAQLQNGPRNPGSEGHRLTEAYLTRTLNQYAGSRYVFKQDFTHRGYAGDSLQMSNIIAAFNPSSSDRIMLCAHWDTRPRAEQDPENTEDPILGADDGASGVAVLLELARLFSEQHPPIGVDIVLFDGEDYGKEGNLEQYFLGSRYWANNPPVANYKPRFAILLDMVGGAEASFPKEGYSRQFAPALVREVWSLAGEQGADTLFVDAEGSRISDDHVVINGIRAIPVIDIIHHRVDDDGSAAFPPYWHTQDDTIEHIDPQTLGAVGAVLAELIYNRI